MKFQICCILLIFLLLYVFDKIEKENFNFPNPICPSCHLRENGKVSTECIRGNNIKNPILVAGRSAGRTRQCRKLL